MPKYTPNLNIQLADPATDGNQTFNIETMINDPVEKLDEALGLVPVSGDVRVATTGNIVLSGAQTIDGIALAAGNRVLVKNQTAGKENGIYTVATGPWTRAVDANSTAKLAAGINVYVEEGAANGKTQWQMTNTGAVTLDTTAITFEKTGGPASATDAIIGSRTVSDTTAPTGDTGTITTLFGWLGSMIKAITGGATWRTLPGMSIAAIKTVLDAATNLGTASTLMKRDASGRAQVAAPSAAADIARKDTVDGAITAHKAEADPHGQYLLESVAEGDTFWRPRGAAPSDLNSIIQPGTYVTDLESAHTNGPSGMGNYLLLKVDVSQSGGVGAIQQTLTGILDSSRHFWRVRTGAGIWGPWNNPAPSKTIVDIAYYVRTDGSDSNAGTANTAGTAFKTIGKAISMIPQIVNHTVNIYVAAGTYMEDIFITGFTGSGAIILNPDAIIVSDSVVVNSLNCIRNTIGIGVKGFKFLKTDNNAVLIHTCSQVDVPFSKIVGASQYAGIAVYYSRANMLQSEISNRAIAINANEMSSVFAWSTTGKGNTLGLFAQTGSKIQYIGTAPGATTPIATGYGGTVQYSDVINPWGDNTSGSRPYVLAYVPSAQSVSSSGWNKVNYSSEFYDQTNNYNAPTQTFVAPLTGFYYVSASVLLKSMPAGVGAFISIWVNGARAFTNFVQNTVQEDVQLNISKSMVVSAGQTIEVHVIQYSAGYVTISQENEKTNLVILREA